MERAPAVDPAWIRDAQRGEHKAIAALYREFARYVERYTERRMGPRARRWRDPKEVAHEVLWEVLTRLPEGELHADDLLRRLLRTARSRILDGLRRHEREQGESISPAHGRIAARQRTESGGSVTRADSRQWLHGLIARLPPDYAQVLRLCALEELSFVEAGRNLGVEPDTLRKRYDRAWQALQRKVAERERQ